MALRKSPSDEPLRAWDGIQEATDRFSVSNQHLIVHVNKECLVTQTRGLRNQSASEGILEPDYV